MAAGNRSTTTYGAATDEDGLRVARWIARYGGDAEDLALVLRLEDRRIRNGIRVALSAGLIEQVQGSDPAFYSPTYDGMIEAGLDRWAGYTWILANRPLAHRRIAAHVTAGLAHALMNDPEWSERFALQAPSTIRNLGRIKGRLRYELSARVGDGVRRHLPVAILKPKADAEDGTVLVEVISEDMDHPEIRSIIRSRAASKEASLVFCYTAPQHLEFVWKVLLQVGREDKFVVYRIPEGGATAFAQQKPESVPTAESMPVKVTPQGAEQLLRILHCVADFEIVGALGVADYLGIDLEDTEWLLNKAAGSGLLYTPQFSRCNGVKVYWLTQEGLDFLDRDVELPEVTFEFASRSKDRLRIASKLPRAYRGDVLVTPAEMQSWDPEAVPSIEVMLDRRLQRLVPDLIWRERNGDVTVAVLLCHPYSYDELRGIIEGFFFHDGVARLVVVLSPRELELAEDIVQELAVQDRVGVVALPRPEKELIKERKLARERRAGIAVDPRYLERQLRKPGGRRKQVLQVADPAETEARVQQVTDPKLVGTIALSPEVSEQIDELVQRAGVRNDRRKPHWLLVVKLAVWCLQRGWHVRKLTSSQHAVSSPSFVARVRELRDAGVWDQIVTMLAQTDPQLASLDWEKFNSQIDAGAVIRRPRQDLLEPWLADQRLISDATAEEINRLLRERRLWQEGLRVSWRLTVDVLIWCVENGVDMSSVRAETHKVGYQTLRVRLAMLKRSGIWQEIPQILRRTEPERPPLVLPVVSRPGRVAPARPVSHQPLTPTTKATRQLVVDPELPNQRLLKPQTVAEITHLLGEDADTGQVSWQLALNVALWCIENNVDVATITRRTHKLHYRTFEARLVMLHRTGVWERLPEILARHEPERGEVNLKAIDFRAFNVAAWRTFVLGDLRR